MALRDGEMILSSSEVAGERLDARGSAVDSDDPRREDRTVVAGVLVYLVGSALAALVVGAVVSRLAPESSSMLVWCAVAGLVAVFAGLRVRSLLGLSLRFTGRFLG